MNEDDFRALIAIVQENLRGIGALDLADEASYVVSDPETGDHRLPLPSERLIEMLLAFERYMAVQDQATYAKAMGRIRGSVQGSQPEGAIVRSLQGGEDELSVNLAESPELSVIREDVLEFVRQLVLARQDPPRRGPLI